jgi:O-antigen/teichoic acid export membrane protein
VQTDAAVVLAKPGLWKRAAQSGVLRSASWLTLAQLVRLFAQIAYVVLIARALGAAEFGQFVGAVALITIVVPFSGLGAGNLIVLHGSRRPETIPVSWANAALVSMLGGALFTGLIALVGAVVLPGVPTSLFLAVGAADLIAGRIVEASVQAFQALERFAAMALVSLIVVVGRAIAALLLVALVRSPDAQQWALWYVVAIVAGAAVASIAVKRSIGIARPRRSTIARDLREGPFFSLGLFASAVYTDADKTLVARLSGFEAAGVYAAGYRAIAVASAPVAGLFSATYTRFFRRGQAGIGSTRELAGDLSLVGTAYGLAAGAVMLVCAPAIPVVLGQSFAHVDDVIRWLAPLPLLQALHNAWGDALTGAGHQRLRSLIQLAAAGLNVGLNLLLIPALGWEGAAIATVTSYALLAFALLTTTRLLALRHSSTS